MTARRGFRFGVDASRLAVLLLCAAALVATCRATCTVQRVVIIGAGVAGAAAANKIMASNPSCFKVQFNFLADKLMHERIATSNFVYL